MTSPIQHPASGAPAEQSGRRLRPSTVQPVSLRALRAGTDIALAAGDDQQMVTGITIDSHDVRPGDLYVALPGVRMHGAQFAQAAKGAGSVAILTDPAGVSECAATGLPVLVSRAPRASVAELAARVYAHPERGLQLLALTGTNGKTTTCFLLEAGLLAAGRHVGTIGTNGFRVDAQPLAVGRSTITTPESTDLAALLAVFAERGVDTVAMEVSSIALDQHRVDALRFAVAGFTNLGRDHLDYHHSMDAYFDAKARLFAPEQCARAVLNGDDPYGQELARRVGPDRVRLVGFGADCHYRILAWTPASRGGAAIELRMPDRNKLNFEIDLPGEFNVRNAVTALAMIDVAGFDLAAALPGLSRATVPGRMQLVPLGADGPRVYVDFAHTPQAVASSLSAVHGRVIAVLGAGGDRDASKRGPMGAAAVHGADVVVVTDDNPRSESPAAIRAMVLVGAQQAIKQAQPGSRASQVQLLDGGDRRHAIGLALGLAGPDDAIVIMGKGHEKTQQIGDFAYPFDDVDVAHELWRVDESS